MHMFGHFAEPTFTVPHLTYQVNKALNIHDVPMTKLSITAHYVTQY